MAKPPRLIFLLNSAHRRMQQWVGSHQERVAIEAGLAGTSVPTPAHSGVLFALEASDGATMGELAQALALVPSAVSGLVQRMEGLRWVTRKPCPADARTQRAWLTPAGRKQLPSLHEALARMNGELVAGFTDAELQTVARWLRHVQQLNGPRADGSTNLE